MKRIKLVIDSRIARSFTKVVVVVMGSTEKEHKLFHDDVKRLTTGEYQLFTEDGFYIDNSWFPGIFHDNQIIHVKPKKEIIKQE